MDRDGEFRDYISWLVIVHSGHSMLTSQLKAAEALAAIRKSALEKMRSILE